MIFYTKIFYDHLHSGLQLLSRRLILVRNTLIIGDTHLPFEVKGYLEFCKQTQKKFKCTNIIHIGDLVDNHAISYHEHDPDGWSPLDEMRAADEKLLKWFKAFPKVSLCRGNHDVLVDRKGKTVGLPRRCFQSFRNIWNLPKAWVDDFEFEFDNVRYVHGNGYSGKSGHVKAMEANRQSTVIGHLHSVAGVEWDANSRECIFGMSVGCGIDKDKYAFEYGRYFKKKPIISCGVVLDNGRFPLVIPMEL